MSREEENNDVRNFFLGLIGLILFLILMIKGAEKYADYSFEQEMKKEAQLQKKVVKIVDYQDSKNRIEQMEIELKKIIETKDIDVKQKKSIKSVLMNKYYCDRWDNKNPDCYIEVEEKMMPFGLLFKDKNISKLFSSELTKELLVESQEKKNIIIPIENNSKNEAYLTIVNTYKSLLNDYIEQFEYCKKEEKRYEKDRDKKEFDRRVVLQQNKTLLTCYETLKLTEEGLESTTKNVDENYSKKIDNQVKDMAKIFSQNKKMIEDKLVELRTKIN